MLADIHRITRRIPRIIAIFSCYLMLVITMLIVKDVGEFHSVVFLKTLSIFAQFIPIAIGVIELGTIFSGDFKAKTMQAAIGLGISRTKVVVSKFLESIILIFFDLLVFLGITFLIATVLGVHFTPDQILEPISRFLYCWLKISCYISFVMILAFYLQTTGIATVLYLVLSFGVLDQVLSLALTMGIIKKFHLESYLLSNILTSFQTRMILGNFNFGLFLSILAYMLLGLVLSVIVFKKRELEF